MYLSVTGLTQAHEVVHRVRSTFRDRQDVVNLLHRSQPTFPQTYLAERMYRRVPVTDTSPRMTVLLVYVGTAFVLVILAAFFYTVLVTVLSVTEVRTTWVGTRSLGFARHLHLPSTTKATAGLLPTMASTHSCMILLYHIVNEKSSTILLISYRTVVWRDEDTKSHRGISPDDGSLHDFSCYHYTTSRSKSRPRYYSSFAIQKQSEMLDRAILFVVRGRPFYIEVLTDVIDGVSLTLVLVPVKGLQDITFILR